MASSIESRGKMLKYDDLMLVSEDKDEDSSIDDEEDTEVVTETEVSKDSAITDITGNNFRLSASSATALKIRDDKANADI